MENTKFKRMPNHIGIIPDGNRRWALEKGLDKKDGYRYGVKSGFELYNTCIELGIQEMTFYGFTQDNTKRPREQRIEFTKACIDSVGKLSSFDADLLVVGNTESPMFPKELMPYTKRTRFGKGLMKVNFLVNYGWNWDLNCLYGNDKSGQQGSKDVSRMDLIIRWGGRHRLSGFLPIQSIYSDMYFIDDMWPDFKPDQLYEALSWYQYQDVTLGG